MALAGGASQTGGSERQTAASPGAPPSLPHSCVVLRRGMGDRVGMELSAAPPAAAGRRPLQAALTRAGFALTALLPVRLSQGIGGFLGALAFRLRRRTRHVTLVNLTLCFPELSERDRRRLGRKSAAHTGRFVLELGGIWTWPRERTLALVRAVEGMERVEEARRRGRGVLLITPHFGSWELAGLHVSAHFPMTTLYKPPRVAELEGFYTACRARLGARLVPATPSGIGGLVKALRRGEVIGVLPDQDPGHGSGVFAPFFGVQANTSVLIPRLVERTGCALFHVSCERLDRGRGFRLCYLPASEELSSGDVAAATRALNADLERLIRRAPEQYLWSYKRFRIRPPGEQDPYR